jgi:hypothetical protein
MSLHLDREGTAPSTMGQLRHARRIGPWSRRHLQRETSWFKLVDFDPMQTVPDIRSRPFSFCVTTATNTRSTLQWRRHHVSRPSFLCFQIEDFCTHLRLAHPEVPGALVRMVPVWRIDQFSSWIDQNRRRSSSSRPNAYVAFFLAFHHLYVPPLSLRAQFLGRASHHEPRPHGPQPSRTLTCRFRTSKQCLGSSCFADRCGLLLQIEPLAPN